MSFLRVVENFDLAVEIIGNTMGEYHKYYAKASKDLNSRGLVALLDGKLVGSVIFYKVSKSLDIGVIYYIGVIKSFRNKGYGKVLLASAEELLSQGSKRILYMATISKGNESSVRLFRSMGYKIINLNKSINIEPKVLNIMKKLACAHEDEYAALKVEGVNFIEALNHLKEFKSLAKYTWKIICYIPWLRSLGLGRKVV